MGKKSNLLPEHAHHAFKEPEVQRAQKEVIIRTIKKEGWKAVEAKLWQKYEDEMTPKERYNLGLALFDDIKERKK